MQSGAFGIMGVKAKSRLTKKKSHPSSTATLAKEDTTQVQHQVGKDMTIDNDGGDLRISSVFDKAWASVYETSPAWGSIWKRCQDSKEERPNDFQIRGKGKQFLFKNGSFVCLRR